MKQIALIFAAFLAGGVGLYIIIVTKAATTPGIFAGCGFVALSLAIAIPTEFKTACASIAPYVPMIGGRRASDPQVPKDGD